MNLPTEWSPNNASVREPHSSRAKAAFTPGFVFLGLMCVSAVASYLLTSSALFSLAILMFGLLPFFWTLGAKSTTGIFLLLIPIQWLAIALLQFNGVSQYKEVSAIKELALVAATAWLLPRVHFEFILPDMILGGTLLLVFFEQIFHPDLQGMRNDWEWTLAYLLGRALVLSPDLQATWAKCAVWMCAVLALIGAWEVEVLGSIPRLLLLQATEGDTKLPAPFLATGYIGFRAASTMVSPLSFSALCMVGLILWWTYMKNPLPAVLIAAGLALTLTRSAVAATLLGVTTIALHRREYARVALFGGIAVVGFLIAIPTLDLNRFLQSTFSSSGDTSVVGHQLSVIQGFSAMIEHPLGLGAGTVGPRTLVSNGNALNIENSYLTIAVEYSVLAGLLYAGFFVACLWILFRAKTPIALAAFSILLGFGLLLSVGPLHIDIPLACWVWVTVGMGITDAQSRKMPSLETFA